MNSPTNPSEIKEQSLREILEQYTRYWYLFVLGVLTTLVLAFVYLRYATSYYETKSTIIIKDEKRGGGAAELAAFADLSFFSNLYSDKIESELVILSSKTLITETVKELNLNVSYFIKGAIKTTELYDYIPFKVNYLIDLDTVNNLLPPTLIITPLSETEFKITDVEGTFSNTHSFGDIIKLSFGDILVVPSLENTKRYSEFIDRSIIVEYHSIENIANQYKDKMSIIHDGKKGDVVTLTLESPLPKKGQDFINELIYQYNQDAINDRNQIAKKTSLFIDSRLEIITKELDSVETNKEIYKKENRLTNIEAEAELVLENASDFNKRQVDVGTQLAFVNSMIDYIEESPTTDVLPQGLGIEGEASSSVNTYNQLVLERNKLLENSTSKNPVIINLNSQIEQLQLGILENLKNQRRGFQIATRDLNIQENKFNSKLSQVPTQEKLFRGIVRQQNIKEQLYLFLLQQREETSISLAVTSPKAKVVDSAYTGKIPVSPKKLFIYLLAVLGGIIIPFLILYVYYLLNTKVANRQDVERVHFKTPLVGEIPKLKKSDEELIGHNDRSILAESFRILRTNLQYLLIDKFKDNDEAKNIFVTSTIKGEGKTFIAFNLALTLAQTGKKVVLVGADIRNPQLHRYLPEQFRNKKGLTEYIVDSTLNTSDLVEKSEYSTNLDIILSGVIPPNPAELLMQSRTKVFFEELRQKYDYIIVDTAPSMLVTDTILINKLADLTLYVIRAGYTDKKLLEFPLDSINEGRLSNLALVLNNVSLNNFGYGNKYGYTYNQEKKSLLNKLFK